MEIRNLIPIAAALVVGIVVGASVTYNRVSADLAPVAPDMPLPEAAATGDAMAQIERDANQAKAEAEHWRAEAERLQAKLSSVPAVDESQEDFGMENTDWMFESGANPSMELDAALRDELAELEEYRERDQERRERSEEWRSRERERSGERQAEMRERMEQMFDDQIARTTDPAAQQRIAAIEEYMNYNRELATQMRRTETDEEREAIRAALEANMQTTQDLMRAQQDYMLGEALAGTGISNPQDQANVIGAVRESMSDPFFRMGGGMGGWGGRGPGGPGWGGGDGRGRGGPPGR